MIGILPAPLPGELIYGVVATYARGLYGVEYASPSASGWLGLTRASQNGLSDAPRILRLAHADPEAAIARLWRQNSLIPFATAAMSDGRRAAIYDSICRSEKRNPESLATVLLIPINSRHSVAGLRWCDECAAQDKRAYGRAYWHRAHQLPGTVICLRHRCWLNATNGAVKGKLYAGPEDIPASEVRPRLRKRIPPLVLATARLEAEWLSGGDGVDVEQVGAALVYEVVRRADVRGRPNYSDGWKAIAVGALAKACDIWWDSWATPYWTVRQAILVRTIFAVGRRDVMTVRVLAAMAFLGVTLAKVKAMDWKAILAAELAERGVNPLSTRGDALQQALNEEQRTARRKMMAREYFRRYPERSWAATKRWRERHPEEARARERAWRAKNPEKVRASRKRYRAKNPERVRARNRRYRARVRERKRESEQESHAEKRGKVRGSARGGIRRTEEATPQNRNKGPERFS